MAEVNSKASSLHVESSKPLNEENHLFDGLSDEETRLIEKKCKPFMDPMCFGKHRANLYLVVRKIDLHLISALFLLFIFNILDRSNIANARLGGMQEDLGLSDTQYQTAVAIMVSQPKIPLTGLNYGGSSHYQIISLLDIFWAKFQATLS